MAAKHRHHAAPLTAEEHRHIDALLADGEDRKALDCLLSAFGDDVSRRAALAFPGEDDLARELRHETFVEAYRHLAALKALPSPSAYVDDHLERELKRIRRAEKKRRTPRDPNEKHPDDWCGAVRWEAAYLDSEPKERETARRDHRLGRVSVWPAVFLGLLSAAALFTMWQFLP